MRKCFVYLFIFESGQMYKSLNNQAINVEKDPLPCCHNCIKSRPWNYFKNKQTYVKQLYTLGWRICNFCSSWKESIALIGVWANFSYTIHSGSNYSKYMRKTEQRIYSFSSKSPSNRCMYGITVERSTNSLWETSVFTPGELQPNRCM